MILCIDGTDIAALKLAFQDDAGATVREEVFATRPEDFLSHIVAFMGADDVTGIRVACGPGSATALRASIAIAETLAYAKGIPVLGGTQPIYAHEARITPSKKDNLRRSL